VILLKLTPITHYPSQRPVTSMQLRNDSCDPFIK